MIIYEVRLHIQYEPHISYGFFLRKSSAEELLEKLKDNNKYYFNDYYIEEHSVNE